MTIKIKMDIKLLSVNQAWQGKRFKTERYKNFESEVLYKLPALTIPPPPYKIRFIFGVSKLTDWDNPIKPLQDILQKKYGFNDRDIYKAEIEKHIVTKGNEFFQVELEHLASVCTS